MTNFIAILLVCSNTAFGTCYTYNSTAPFPTEEECLEDVITRGMPSVMAQIGGQYSPVDLWCVDIGEEPSY